MTKYSEEDLKALARAKENIRIAKIEFNKLRKQKRSLLTLLEELYQIVNDMWTGPYDSSDYDLGIEKGINIAIEKLEAIING